MRRRHEDMLGNRRLEHFDFCIIGSGAGGGTAAHVLTAAGKNVLVLEAGGNAFPKLDRAGDLHLPLHSNDELKYSIRNYIQQDDFLEPRVFRTTTASDGALSGDVNVLPKAVGGAFQHADAKTPRFNKVDFRLKSAFAELAGRGVLIPGFNDGVPANFTDWPFSYDDLEPFYVEAEDLYGVQGKDGDNVFESTRSRPYPMPPGVPMYLALVLADGARQVELPGYGALQPHAYPAAINSRPRDGREPCVDCGLCSGFGCPNNSKGSPAVTTLRRALLTGRCQVRFNAMVTRLVNDGGHVSAVEYVDSNGHPQMAVADAFILAASPIESARLCFLSPTPSGAALGNSSGQVGQNLMFHLQTNVNGFLPQRVHGQRGRAVTHGISDFRGVEPGGDQIRVFTIDGQQRVALGGICEFGGSQGQPITEDYFAYTAIGIRFGQTLKNALRDLPLGQHLFGLTMQAEDAPQRTNFVDLDTRYRDVYGLPVARVTYKNHVYELATRRFYTPLLQQVVAKAGAPDDQIFLTPCQSFAVGPPTSRHIMGTLRMGNDATQSVVSGDAGGKKLGQFHDVDNLFATDGSVFPTSSGYNPTLTIIAVALKIAHGLAGTAPGT